MPPMTLDGDTLGKKHKTYNKLVEDAIANKNYELSKINADDSDVDNLLKIDIASKTRNVDYIIEAMKSDDMLYVSRAIKTSTWLITDQQYANIINPEYLHTQLFPSMNTKAVHKLMLHIRLNLNYEDRVEAFHDYLKETKEAYKWLPNCSISYIKNVVENKRRIPLSLFKRLCRKSVIFLAYIKKVEDREQHIARKEILQFLNTYTAEVLNLLENDKIYYMPGMGKKYTEILMKKCPQRILEKFEIYVGCVDLSVVAKYLNKKDIKSFLLKQVQNDKTKNYFRSYDNLKHFVKNMPKDERFEFIKENFIDNKATLPISCSIDSYLWYQYAPFDIAFTDLKKLIRIENSSSERCAMLSVLITCARRNPQHIKLLLKFYFEKHINEPFKFKVQFVNNLLTQIATYEFDSETWNILDQLFHSMEVYTESENNVQMCLKSIIMYKILHDENVPDIVEKKLTFDTFYKFQKKLNQVQQNKLFTYLFNSVFTKIQKLNITNESYFNETVKLLKNALTLLNDWKKDINNYPFLLNKIQELVKIKKDNSWKSELSYLYNVNRTWRRHMFNESLSLNLGEEVCLNALKHEPQLLTRHDEEMEKLRTNDALSLRRLLAKLRIYWPQSFAQQWIKAYSDSLNKSTRQKALIRGLFMLLPQKKIIDLAKAHAPKDHKIKWGETDQAEVSLRKNIAQHLHVARPLIPLDTVLLYAKGDYLQYAVPSLNAILYYLSKNESRKHLTKLLDAPVSLQKFGLHLAFVKLKPEELKPIFSEIWNNTKNSTIRAVLFTHTYQSICKVNNPTAEKELWLLLSMFIDNLTPDESKEIYKKLSRVRNVPRSIRPEFYMKSFEFLTSLPERVNSEAFVNDLLNDAPNMMDLLNEDFVADKLLSPVQTRFNDKTIELFASYVLCGKTEENQLHRYRRALVPAIEYAFQSWNHIAEEEYYIKNTFNKLIKSLIWNFRKFVTNNKIPIPAKLFTEIKIKMEQLMPLDENYVLYTSWKIIVEYVKLVEEHKSLFYKFESGKFSSYDIENRWMSDDVEKEWKQMHIQISPMLGPIIVKFLKEDTEKYFPTIYQLFKDALEKMFEDLSFQRYVFTLETLKHMLNDQNCIPSYIIACNMIPKYGDDEVQQIRAALRNKITSHPSKEVQMHYHSVFGNIPYDEFRNVVSRGVLHK